MASQDHHKLKNAILDKGIIDPIMRHNNMIQAD